MAFPLPVVRVDWLDTGAFSGPYDLVSPLFGPAGQGLRLTRGLGADLAGEIGGSFSFDLDNASHRYTPDRNWLDNPSFEAGTSGWSTGFINSLINDATSLTQVVDNAGQGGTRAAEATLTATTFSGVSYRLPYRFRAGVTYALRVWLRSISGTTSVRVGLASIGTPADISVVDPTITTSWAAYSVTWTPSADRSDAVLLVETRVATAAVLRIDAVQLNPGSTPNAYVEGPTRGQLQPGRPVHFYANWAGVDRPKFFGEIVSLTPDPARETVRIECRDLQKRLDETDVVVPARQYTARDVRVAVLDDFERGNRNLLPNPSFEVDTAGWEVTGSGTLVRDAADWAGRGEGVSTTVVGAASALWTPGAVSEQLRARVRLAPVMYAGQTYRFSAWLRAASGTPTLTFGLWDGAAFQLRSITLTTTWRRYSVAATIPTDRTAASGALYLLLLSQSTTGIKIDNASVTRGRALYPFALADSGRWPNHVGNGGFEAGTNGWQNGFHNLVANPSFEVNTTGWSAGLRVTAEHYLGVASLGLSASGTVWSLGSVLAGTTYQATARVKSDVSPNGANFDMHMDSAGTPSDTGTIGSASVPGGWTEITCSWTPSANRADGRLVINASGGNGWIDAVQVVASPVYAPYSDTGYGGGVANAAAAGALRTDVVKYGWRAWGVTTAAAIGSGVVYDFNSLGSYFVAGRSYTGSVWVNPSSSFPYRIGIGANKGDGTWDQVLATGTATANVWTQVTFTWTPSADRSPTNWGTVVLFVEQTDATARTVVIDGVRVNPGATAEPYELAQWTLPVATSALNGEASDVYASGVSFDGSALAALTELNRLTQSRHWARATMTAPFYAYVAEDRAAFAAKTSTATLSEDVQGWEDLDVDRDAIVNVVEVSSAIGTDVYSDADSVGRYGSSGDVTINGSDVFPDSTIPAQIAATILARYGVARLRPSLPVEQQYANQLTLDVNDMVTASIERFLVRSARFVILREDLEVQQGGRSWVTTYKLEEYP